MTTQAKRFTFGMTIRAYRERFGIMPDKRGLLRISIVPSGYLCELRPLGLVPTKKSGHGEYVIWWEGGKSKEIIESSPFLQGIVKIWEAYNVILNEEGERL